MKYFKYFIVLSFCLCTIAQAQIWKQIGLPAMNVSKIIIDSVNQRAILFGGGFGGNFWSDGVYEMSLTDTSYSGWTRINVSGPHHKRGYHTFTYDSKLKRALVFGGDTTSGYPNYNNDVWALNMQLGSESWQILNTTGMRPVPRANPADIYHPVRNSLIIFSGIDINGDYPDDVWEFKLDSLVWRQITITGTKPMPRQAMASLYDKQNNRMIIFGGAAYGVFYDDVWALDLTKDNEHWTRLYPTGYPIPARCAPAYGFDATNKKLYVFGGWDYSQGQIYNDVYVLDVAAMSWAKIYPTGTIPQHRRNAAGSYDMFNDNFIIFGGDNFGDFLSDTDILFLNPTQSDFSEWTAVIADVRPDILIKSPSNGDVRIRYILSGINKININIIDLNGRLIRTLYTGKAPALSGWLQWDRKDNHNREVSTGIYFARLETDDFFIAKKFVLVK
jgi:N-acetylneuraminic acid mutarotase